MTEAIESEAIVRDGILPGDVAIVTGASRGFGRAIARRLAAGGARVACLDVIEDEGAETADLCRDGGAEAEFFRCDMGDADNITAAAAAVMDKWGAPYAVVNNAGIHPRSLVLDCELEMWERTLRVNLTGTFLCSRAFARAMADAGRGAIVNIASGRALQGAVKGAHYAASKAGIISLTKTLALEWAKLGIRVNCVIPGVSETAQPLEATNLEELLSRGKNNPLGRIGQPEDIAGVVAFLLSVDAAYMTGQSVACNGGVIMIP